jgi:hypothetical protein
MRLRLIAPLAMAAAASALGIVPVAGAAPIPTNQCTDTGNATVCQSPGNAQIVSSPRPTNYDSQNPFFGPFGNILIFHHRGAHR